MALIAYDGFDHYGTGPIDILGRRAGGFQWNALNAVTFVSPGRNNAGSAVQLTTAASSVSPPSRLSGVLTARLSQAYFGFGGYIYSTSPPGRAGAAYVQLAYLALPPSLATTLPDGLIGLTVAFRSDTARIEVWRGDEATGALGTLIATSSNNAFTTDAWNYFEFYVAIDGSAGALRIRSNGQDVLNVTGQNTELAPALRANSHGYNPGDVMQSAANTSLWFVCVQTGNSAASEPAAYASAAEGSTTIDGSTAFYAVARNVFDGIAFVGPAWGGTPTFYEIDDFYIADTAAGAGLFPFNFFGGDVRVVTLHPIGNVGTPGWTPLVSTNWVEVSEVHSDGDTSYNSTATVGAKDLFNFAALPATISVVLAVQVTGCYRKDDAGTRTISQHVASGGTEVAGPDMTIPGNYVYVSDFYVQDPNGSAAWTVASVNALQAGYVLTA